jgi:hypothetical protein
MIELEMWLIFIGIATVYAFITAFISKAISKNYLNNIKENKKIRTAWLVYYTKIRVLISIIFTIFSFEGLSGISFGVGIFYIIFLITLFFITQKRTELGYKLTLVSIALDMLLISLEIISNNGEVYYSLIELTKTYIFTISLMSLIFGLPNYIYFMKRKSLFCKEADKSSLYTADTNVTENIKSIK